MSMQPAVIKYNNFSELKTNTYSARTATVEQRNKFLGVFYHRVQKSHFVLWPKKTHF